MEKAVEEADGRKEINRGEFVLDAGASGGCAVFRGPSKPLCGDNTVNFWAGRFEIFSFPPFVAVLIEEKFFPALVEGGAVVLHPANFVGGIGPDSDKLFTFVILSPRTLGACTATDRLIP